MSAYRERYYEFHKGLPFPGEGEGGRVGSEFCARLLPSPEDMTHLSRLGEPARLSLVTPVAGPDEVGNVRRAVEAAVAEGWGEVVVNDWGILSLLGSVKGTVITAGRLLMRLRRGPGARDRWEDLDHEARRYFAWGSLYDSPFLAFLKEKGASRIELDRPRQWLPVPETKWFRLSMHTDTRLISVSANCPWLYDKNTCSWKPLKACGFACTAQRDMVMTAPGIEGPLLLRGRALLEPIEQDFGDLELPESLDRIIHHSTRE